MKKHVRLLALTTALLFQVNICSAITYPKADYENFPDVIGTKYENAALYLKAFDYISGYPDGTYQPEKNITRAELIRMVFEFSPEAQNALQNQTEPLNNFSDVPMDHWAKQHIEVAAQVGIASGYGNGTFKPDNLVTHAEALTILLNVHGLKETISTYPFSWPDNYIIYSEYNNFSTMYSTTEYSNNANRGDVAIYISNIRNINWE